MKTLTSIKLAAAAALVFAAHSAQAITFNFTKVTSTIETIDGRDLSKEPLSRKAGGDPKMARKAGGKDQQGLMARKAGGKDHLASGKAKLNE